MYVERFADAGADILTVHVEVFQAREQAMATLEAIRSAGCGVGISLKPATPVSAIVPYIHQVDRVLVMSVDPGFGGQGFIAGSEAKIKEVSALVKDLASKHGHRAIVAVDGGIKLHNALNVVRAGADLVVVGSAVFGSSGEAPIEENIKGFVELFREHQQQQQR